MNSKTNLQESAFEKLSKLKIGAIFTKMGTGKTRVALELADYNQCELLLYVCPNSVKITIETEIQKWGVITPYTIISYESISQSDRVYLQLLAEIRKYTKVFIIADESIFIKNSTSLRFERLKELRKLCEYALILNGTPLSKNEWDLYNQMSFLSDSIFNMTRPQFESTFFKRIHGRKNGKKFDFLKLSEVNADALYQFIEPYVIYSDVSIHTPKVNVMYVPTHDPLYDDTKLENIEVMRFSGNFDMIMAMLTTLRKIASNNQDKNKKIVEIARGKRVLVYVGFIEEAEMLHSTMDSYLITGEVKDRDAILENFKKNNKPLIMTLGTGSYGLNVDYCDTIIFSSVSFDYGAIEQASHRINRLSQKNSISIHYILADLGINRMMIKNLDKKKSLKELINKHIKGGSVDSWLKSI